MLTGLKELPKIKKAPTFIGASSESKLLQITAEQQR
jgi:hypothetical protein